MANEWKPSGYNLDDLFTTQEQRDGEKLGKLQETYITELVPFKNHTFQVVEDNKMNELMESIEQNGLIHYPLVFHNEDGQLELISGHRRLRACTLLGWETIPVLVRDMARDEAIIYMGESNLQEREEILPSEKAHTYKAMYDAMKRQGKRTDLTSSPLGTKLRSDTELAKKVGVSRNQIQRYIDLCTLIPDLLNLLDNKVAKRDGLKMGMRPALELAGLPQYLQQCVYDTCCAFDKTPSHAQALQFKKLNEKQLLDEQEISRIMEEDKPNQKEGLKLSEDIVSKYLGDCNTLLEKQNKIIRALALLEKQERIQKRQKENEISR